MTATACSVSRPGEMVCCRAAGHKYGYRLRGYHAAAATAMLAEFEPDHRDADGGSAVSDGAARRGDADREAGTERERWYDMAHDEQGPFERHGA